MIKKIKRIKKVAPPPEYVKPNDRKVIGTTRCLVCGREQEDKGQRNSCTQCGMMPIPSKAYPKGHLFRK